MPANVPGTAARDDRADISGFEPALKAARDTIGNLIDSSPFCVYLVDADLRFLHVSDGAKKFFGDAQNLPGRDLYQVLRTVWHEPFAKEVTARFRTTLETGTPHIAARDVAWRKDIPVAVIHELRIERVHLPDGSYAAVCHFHDVTEQRRLESALRDAEERLATQLTAVFRLNELSTITIPVGKIEALYEYMLEAAVAIMHSQYASLQLLEADGDNGDVLRLIAHRGFNSRSALHWRRVYVEATTTCGVALRTRKRFIIPDIERWEGIRGSLDEKAYRGSGIRSVQSTPLFSRTGGLLGMISTHWDHPYLPTDGELRAFDILARQVADFLEATESTEAERQ